MTSFRLISALVLSMALYACSSPTPVQTAPAPGSHPPAYADLLQKYATPRGVRYAAWHANPGDRQKLKEVTDFYATTTAPEGSKSDALAWHLNAYNAWILQSILAKYPTKGPLEGDERFFDDNRIVISGKKTSFNELEQKVIRPTFREPRIHFALNCASTSCPPLNTQPFEPATLDTELDRLTREFVNGEAVQIVDGGKTVRLSRIFDWYGEDFGGKEKVVGYLNGFRTTKLPGASGIQFLEYDWALNAAE